METYIEQIFKSITSGTEVIQILASLSLDTFESRTIKYPDFGRDLTFKFLSPFKKQTFPHSNWFSFRMESEYRAIIQMVSLLSRPVFKTWLGYGTFNN